MRVAILYNDNDIFVEFSTEKFRELLEKYTKELGSVTKALDRVVREIKKEASKL